MVGTAADLPANPRMSRAEYRVWAEAQPHGRTERVDGEGVAMAPELASHADRKAMVWLSLQRAVAAAQLPCHVYPDGMTVSVGDSDYEPDAVLRCGPPLEDRIDVPEPLLLVEVLSPGPRQGDLMTKLADYFRLPTVQHYLVVFATRRQVIHHRRRADGTEIDTQLLIAGELRLDPPGLVVALEDFYAG